jgi:hypothetical protein
MLYFDLNVLIFLFHHNNCFTFHSQKYKFFMKNNLFRTNKSKHPAWTFERTHPLFSEIENTNIIYFF